MQKIKEKLWNLRTFNNLLSVAVILVGLSLVATPWIPNLELWWDQQTKETPEYSSSLLTDATAVVDDGELETVVANEISVSYPQDNRLVIPSIALDTEFFEGGEWVLNQGPWKRPNTSTPDQGGNTVIAGHRFSYGSDGRWIFYHLDKIQPGERIGVYWQGDEYIYEVNGSQIVEPTAIEIEGPTDNDQLTLYTCTPLWTAAQRLVVTADLIKVNRASEV